jgi:hypothetical protein
MVGFLDGWIFLCQSILGRARIDLQAKKRTQGQKLKIYYQKKDAIFSIKMSNKYRKISFFASHDTVPQFLVIKNSAVLCPVRVQIFSFIPDMG